MTRRTSLRGLAVVVTQHAAQTIPAPNAAGCAPDFLARFDQPIAKSLVIPLSVKVSQELGSGLPQRLLPEEDHPVQALFLQASQESLEMRIQNG